MFILLCGGSLLFSWFCVIGAYCQDQIDLQNHTDTLQMEVPGVYQIDLDINI